MVPAVAGILVITAAVAAGSSATQIVTANTAVIAANFAILAAGGGGCAKSARLHEALHALITHE